MAIVIAILLALILVAMMYSNKEASKGVLGLIRGALIVSLILLTWLVIISYCAIYYNLYTDQEWYGLAGIVLACLLPPVLMWLSKDELRSFLKQDDQKRVFKYLIFFLLAAIVFSGIGIAYQEYKKTNPFIAYQVLSVVIGITGFMLYRRSQSLPRGWRDVFEERNLKSEAYDQFHARNNAEHERFNELKKGFSESNADEVMRLENEHYDIIVASQKTLDKQIADADLNPLSGADFVLQGFIYSCMFLAITLAIDLWGWAYDYALTLDFVAGRPLWAGGLVVSVVIGLYTIGLDLYQKYKDKKGAN